MNAYNLAIALSVMGHLECEEMERLGLCEVCDKEVNVGSPHYLTADGCVLCLDHAPTISDAITQHEEILARPDWHPGELDYNTKEDMEAGLHRLKEMMEVHGDYNLASGLK